MKSHLFSIVALSLGLLAGCAVWVLAASPFAPVPGLLVLKNGQIIEGGILREGDRYVVTLGPRGQHGELRVPATEVEVACRDLEEAYQAKRAAIVHPSVKAHCELADWCLRHKLLDRAADELVAAMAIDPRDTKIAAIERRLKATAAPKEKIEKPVFVLPPSQQEIEATLRTLPPEAIEQFTTNIQPLLLSRCAATACHGPSSTSKFHLVRPPLHHANKTRETQRNLFGTLAQISHRGESALLTKALTAHGGSTAAVLDDRDRRQVEQLAAWIQQVQQSSPSQAAKQTADEMVRPATFEEELSEGKPSQRRLPSVGEPGEFQPEASARPLSKNESKGGARPAPGERDPFSADIFNQKFHRK